MDYRWPDGSLSPFAYIGANMLTLEPFYRTVLGKAPTTVAAWAPSDDADCVLWLAASNVDSPTQGNFVTTWTDNSGQSNDVTQTSEALKPTYELNGAIPVVRFDGSDKLQAASAVYDLTKKMSFFVVASRRITQTAALLGTLAGSAGRLWHFRLVSTQRNVLLVNGSGYDYPVTTIADNTMATYSCDVLGYNGNLGTHSMREDGSEIFNNFETAPSTTNDGNFAVGAAYNNNYAFDGDIADVIVINREADADLYTNISEYWSATYGL